ncbi:MAG: protein kinase [Polyangiaceae bacterium]
MNPPPSMQAPRRVGRYAVFQEIAAGGMATVHLGRLHGEAGFTRVVAVKRLHGELARDPEFVAMFLDESRIAARIRHPNVVQTTDVIAAGDELFLVMEYVEGESLVRLLRAHCRCGVGPPPRAVVAAVIHGVLHGLHAAHQARSERGEPLEVVHRDVSPQNVLVGSDGVARVLDFGIAKAVGRAQVTRAGQLKGKLSYMAPEQIRFDRTIDRRTDVWAASVVLWESLTGCRLFSGDERVVVDAIVEGRAPPPSSVVSDIPPELDAVVARGLEVDPAQRWSTAEEMATALARALPLAPPSEVAAWVRQSAAPELAERTAMVASVEALQLSTLGLPPGPHAGAALAAVTPATDRVAADRVATESWPAIGTTHARQQVPARRLWLAGAIAAAVGAACTLAAILVFGGRSASPAETAPADRAPADQAPANHAGGAPPSAPVVDAGAVPGEPTAAGGDVSAATAETTAAGPPSSAQPTDSARAAGARRRQAERASRAHRGQRARPASPAPAQRASPSRARPAARRPTSSMPRASSSTSRVACSETRDDPPGPVPRLRRCRRCRRARRRPGPRGRRRGVPRRAHARPAPAQAVQAPRCARRAAPLRSRNLPGHGDRRLRRLGDGARARGTLGGGRAA